MYITHICLSGLPTFLVLILMYPMFSYRIVLFIVIKLQSDGQASTITLYVTKGKCRGILFTFKLTLVYDCE